MRPFVAYIVLHANDMWRDFSYFYNLVKTFEKNENQKVLLKRVTLIQKNISFTITLLHIFIFFTLSLLHV